MKNRFVSIGLAALMMGTAVTYLPISTWSVSAEWLAYGDILYRIEDDHVVITDFQPEEYGDGTFELIIPEEINGLPVTKISSSFAPIIWNDENHFSGKYICFKRIVIPKTVTDLGLNDEMYKGILSTTQKCESFEVAQDNPAYTIIDNVLFTKDMKTLIAYFRTEENADYTVPDGVETVRADAFRNCLIISKRPSVLRVPSSVLNLQCTDEEFDNIIVDQNNPNYVSLDGAVLNKDMTELIHVFTLGCRDRLYRIPDTVVKIDRNALSIISATGKAYIPKSVKVIDYTKANATLIPSVYCEGSEDEQPIVLDYDGNECTLTEYAKKRSGPEVSFNCTADDNFLYSGTEELTVVEAWDPFAEEYHVPERVNGVPVTTISAQAFGAMPYDTHDLNGKYSLYEFGVWLPTSIKKFNTKKSYDKVNGGYEFYSYNELSRRSGAILHYAGTREQWHAIEGSDAFQKEPFSLDGLQNRRGMDEWISAEPAGTFGFFTYAKCYDGIEIISYNPPEHEETRTYIDDAGETKTSTYKTTYTDSIIIPETIEELPVYRIEGSYECGTLHLSSAVSDISNAYGLYVNEQFEVESENPAFCTVNGVLYNKEQTKIIKIPRKTNTLHIPASVTEIADLSVSKAYEVEADNPVYSSIDGVLYNKEQTKIISVPYETETLHIPASVTEIENVSVSKAYEVEADNPVYSSFDGVLYSKAMTTLYSVPSTLKKGEFAVPDGVTKISADAFQMNELKSVTFPESLENIGAYAFSGSENLVSVVLPESVKIVENGAFSYNRSLQSITIMNPQCEIEDWIGYTICNRYENDNGVFTGTIYGHENSTAQAYAEKYGYNFALIGSEPEQPETKSGDFTGDGMVNLKDVVLLRRYIAGGWNVTTDETVADINRDGAVNLKDVVLLRRYIAGGWNVTL